MDKPMGLYLHIPFCRSKCPYCDFYSLVPRGEMKEAYTVALIKRLQGLEGYTFDTVYFGGGTPSFLGADAICRILFHIPFTENAEITVECNPSDAGVPGGLDFYKLSAAGVNRISLGLQSALDNERHLLGRKAGVREAEYAIHSARNAGIDNISLDLMLGVGGQTPRSLARSLDFCLNSGARHISAYLLKIEPNTFYYKNRNMLSLPDEDTVCDLYLQCCSTLESGGFAQYEISNFSLAGFESKHNLKYWHCEEYLGLGPAAHSFVKGKRFYFERDIQGFMQGCEPTPDGEGGDFEEYAMLALRLREGLRFDRTLQRFGFPVPPALVQKAKSLVPHGLVQISENAITLTVKGFLLSNTVIAELLNNL